MFTLSDDIVEAREQIEEAKRVTAVPTNRDIPTTPSLTGRQLYVQFCYRMAKFDLEFATMDPVMAQSWLNTGMTRLLHEFEKRFLATPGDRSAKRIFGMWVTPIMLDITTLDGCIYRADLPIRHDSYKLYPDPLGITIKPSREFPDSPGVMDRLPNWWPYTFEPPIRPAINGKWVAKDVSVSYIELEGTDDRKNPFWISNSFSELDCGVKTRVYIRRRPGGFPIYIWANDPLKEVRGGEGVINKTELPPSDDRLGFVVTSVMATMYNFDELVNHWFIETDSDDYLLDFPVEYFNDVIDYTIDAYFESMFFHQFGKYSMKQGRQDADGSPTTVNRTQKLDAVPPQRYRVGAGA